MARTKIFPVFDFSIGKLDTWKGTHGDDGERFENCDSSVLDPYFKSGFARIA